MKEDELDALRYDAAMTNAFREEVARLRNVVATCEHQFRMLARLSQAQRVTSGGKAVPKWEAVSTEANAAVQMCVDALSANHSGKPNSSERSCSTCKHYMGQNKFCRAPVVCFDHSAWKAAQDGSTSKAPQEPAQ